MRKEPKISVIIPVYNAVKYIDRCMNSVTGQTYKNLEILLMIKQGDIALEKCLQWQKRDWRITIISRKDTSLGDARNYAMRIAKGKYVAFVDADDWLEDDYMENMVVPLEDNDQADVSCCGFDWNDDKGSVGSKWISEHKGMVRNGKYISWVTVWIRMYKKNWLIENQIEFFDGSHEDDAYYWLVKAYANYIYFVPKVLYHYNQGNVQSLMHVAGQRMLYFKALAFTMEKLLLKKKRIPWQGLMLKSILADVPYKIYDLGEDRDNGRIAAGNFLCKYFPIDKIVIFGSGNDANNFLIRHYEINVIYIVDNDASKWGKKIHGIEIKPYTSLKNETALVIIASSAHADEMEEQLVEDGYTYYMTLPEFEFTRSEYSVFLNMKVG